MCNAQYWLQRWKGALLCASTSFPSDTVDRERRIRDGPQRERQQRSLGVVAGVILGRGPYSPGALIHPRMVSGVIPASETAQIVGAALDADAACSLLLSASAAAASRR